ncbi:MAG: biotin/lipoyl-containing protein [Bacteroidota bacterium]
MTEVFVEQFIFQLAHKKGQHIVNGQNLSPEITRINNRLFHVIHEGKSYNVFIHKLDKEANEVSLSVNGKRTKVKVQSRIEKLLKDLGMEHSLSKKLDNLKAPMPGLIHSLKVETGQEVKKGDPLLILEAMKMENIIKSPGEGIVKEIHVEEKNSVEKNALLITFA